MGKYAAPAVEDASLDAIAAATEMYYCNGQPATRAAAIASKCHAAAIALTGADFSKTDGAAGARVLTVVGKSVNATVAQSNDHVALCSGANLLYVATAAAQTSNVGSPISSNPFAVTVGPVT